jgi:hypothetical protein
MYIPKIMLWIVTKEAHKELRLDVSFSQFISQHFPTFTGYGRMTVDEE